MNLLLLRNTKVPIPNFETITIIVALSGAYLLHITIYSVPLVRRSIGFSFLLHVSSMCSSLMIGSFVL